MCAAGRVQRARRSWAVSEAEAKEEGSHAAARQVAGWGAITCRQTTTLLQGTQQRSLAAQVTPRVLLCHCEHGRGVGGKEASY